MATLSEVRRSAMALPGVEEGELHPPSGAIAWRVRGKLVVWERPLRKADFEALGDAAPDGVILGARVPDESVKFALAKTEPDVFFTTPHFDGYATVLVKLDAIDADRLDEVVELSWRQVAPKKLVAELDRGLE
ncbi:MmcQ/YjbR family DNA-binding protein [Agromyces intestinalis]|uniref:MmcQ/YjbR family DNA-binding protein n=1 Tax=Agromyces intestinalis TaxID=2592652 RepID=A0A5C1YI63_9MICO|nr:MmcQ/YjbR family DNA-binding protein [Agromyces intestinalis]QEO14462.1 MmcQ/YjbR family DNA-binding protein [Agromyces intestinalis]